MNQIILPYADEPLAYDKDFYKDYGIFVKPIDYPLSSRKIESLLEIAEMQKFFQCNPVKFIDIMFNIELFDMQALMIQKTWICPNSLLVCSRGLGKALALDTRIPTPVGDKTIADIQVGDYVFDANGFPSKVINVSPIYHNRDCYEIEFSDGEKITSDADHLWHIYADSEIKVQTSKWTFEHFNEYKKITVPTANPISLPEQILPIHPYILGLWLGGGLKSGEINISSEYFNEIKAKIERCEYRISSIKDNSKSKIVKIQSQYNEFLDESLRKLKFKGKRIPRKYLCSSILQRLELLQGIMDSSGTVSDEFCSFVESTNQKRFLVNFEELLVSLGIQFNSYSKEIGKNDNIFSVKQFCFTSSQDFPCFKIKQKRKKLPDKVCAKSKEKQIISINKVASVPTKCLVVDNPDHLFLCGNRNTVTHNSTIIDLSIMSKGMLFNNYWCYIASGSGSQAENTFNTLEKLANDNIDTFSGSTGKVFKNEIEIKNAVGDGFSHSSNGFNYSLYNGAMTQTLNSNIDAKRGFRGSVIFDESGFLSEEMMNVYGAFAVVNKSLRTGKDASGKSIDPIRQRCFPTGMPYQKIYISSASSTDTKFYKFYREFSKEQIKGNPDYCVLHLDCDLALHPTLRGELVAPLLTKSTVEAEMRTNPEKARREYYCIFTSEAGADAVIRRGVITRNEEIRKPLLYNDTGDKKFVICYDPARQRDNSVITIGEIYNSPLPDGSTEKKMRIVNCVNLLDVGKKIKSPMQTPDQVEYLKQLIIDYNGGADGYGNIVGVYIDAGSGGAGINIADYLMPDWTDSSGIVHRGLIDKEFSAEYVKKFPNAVDKVHLMSPSVYKSIMYEAAIELTNQNKISFTSNYDNKGYLMVFDVDQAKLDKEKARISEDLKREKLDPDKFAQKLNEELSKTDSIKTKMLKLDWKDEIALANIDAMKEELVNIVRKKRDSGKDSFDLVPEKANTMHDDRAYTYVMAAYALMEERRKNITKKPKQDVKDLKRYISVRAPKRSSYLS